MMTPQEESRDLITNPLPEEVSDGFLPTYVAAIENDIINIEKEIIVLNTKLSNLNDDKTRILDRAVKGGFLEDARYKIVCIQTTGNRICNPTKLKEQKKWDVYKAAYLEKVESDSKIDLEKKKANVEEKILLGLADKVFGKDVVNLCSLIPVTERWEVKRKLKGD
jgi:hypothetical protein